MSTCNGLNYTGEYLWKNLVEMALNFYSKSTLVCVRLWLQTDHIYCDKPFIKFVLYVWLTIGHKTAFDTVKWSHNPTITWSQNHMITWPHNHMIPKSHDHMTSQSHDLTITWHTRSHYIARNYFFIITRTITLDTHMYVTSITNRLNHSALEIWCKCCQYALVIYPHVMNSGWILRGGAQYICTSQNP